MTVARTGALPNAYKFTHIAVDSFDNRLLKGRVYHDSREDGMEFGSLSELAMILEGLFDELRYPMKSVNQRNFEHRSPGEASGEWLACCHQAPEGERRGKLADLRLHVRYRYFATWQGAVADLGTGRSCEFFSFMEFMDSMELLLNRNETSEVFGLGKKICEVAVRNYDNYIMGGDVSHPAVSDRRLFVNEFQLREQIEAMINPPSSPLPESRIITPRTFQITSGNFGPATFVVRVLFRRNATWQGVITWKEKRQQVNFRSFLEMLLLMQEAVGHSEGWKQKPETAGHAHMA